MSVRVGVVVVHWSLQRPILALGLCRNVLYLRASLLLVLNFGYFFRLPFESGFEFQAIPYEFAEPEAPLSGCPCLDESGALCG